MICKRGMRLQARNGPYNARVISNLGGIFSFSRHDGWRKNMNKGWNEWPCMQYHASLIERAVFLFCDTERMGDPENVMPCWRYAGRILRWRCWCLHQCPIDSLLSSVGNRLSWLDSRRSCNDWAHPGRAEQDSYTSLDCPKPESCTYFNNSKPSPDSTGDLQDDCSARVCCVLNFGIAFLVVKY